MGVFNNFPYANFHELNADWIIEQIREVKDEWEEYKTNMDLWKLSVDDQLAEFQAWFDNLDVQDEVRTVIHELIQSGEFIEITGSQIVSATEAWLAAHITPTTPAVDDTLSISGAAADAKVTGDRISDLKEDIKGTLDFVQYILDNDFGIEEIPVIKGYSDNNNSPTTLGNAPFILSFNRNGVILTSIKLKITQEGTLTIGYIENVPSTGDSYNVNDLVITNKITVNETGTQTIKFLNPFVVPSGGGVFIGINTDTAKWAYGSNGEDKGFMYVSGGNYAYSSNSMGVEFSGLDSADYEFILNNFETMKNTIDIVADMTIKDITILDGYDAGNNTTSSPSTSPFMVRPLKYGYITNLKLNIKTAGTLSIGKINKNYVVTGQTFDFTKVETHEVASFVNTGEQTYELSTPMQITESDIIVICGRTDTAKIAYGSAGTDKGFWYVSGTTTSYSTSSLGITYTGVANSIFDSNNSIYYGKTLSILGDSISTYDGYIPSGNVTYYPAGDVQNVTDTWWKKLIDALGLELNINNSWSGSYVTTNGGADSSGCGARSEALGTNPDVIIVYMGINDFNNEVALGTYDGTTAIPSVTTTFREAYGIMLNKILTKYKTSEVWVCTLPQCERNAETGFPEINGNGVPLADFNKAIYELANAFGVKVLDHNKCGLTYQNMSVYNPDNLHPNKYGHSLIANNDIRQMDAVVRTRYAIS